VPDHDLTGQLALDENGQRNNAPQHEHLHHGARNRTGLGDGTGIVSADELRQGTDHHCGGSTYRNRARDAGQPRQRSR
jgi:hypothetical protein